MLGQFLRAARPAGRVNVRRAESADAAAIAAVVRAVFDEYGFTWDADGYHADLADAARHYGGAFWVAEVDGEIVGTVGLDLGAGRVGGLPGCDCSLERLYVLDRARGRGAGSALLQAAIDEARAHGRRAARDLERQALRGRAPAVRALRRPARRRARPRRPRLEPRVGAGARPEL